MKNFSKTLLASAVFAAGVTGMNTAHAVEWSLGGEIAVELTDVDGASDLDLSVTTTDLVVTVAEKFGDVEVEGYAAFTKADLATDADFTAETTSKTSGLEDDGAGITVSGGFGSLYVGNDGTGVQVSGGTDVMYNNSDFFFSDDTTNVIDYGLPLSGDFSLNVFVDISGGDNEDIDAVGAYGSYAFGDLTFALGLTSFENGGAYSADDVVDLYVGYESGPIAAGFGYQTVGQTGDDTDTMAVFLTYTAGPVAITPYYEQTETGSFEDDAVALNVTYSFTDNFSAFFETASFDTAANTDNTEVGLSLTF